MGCFAGILRCLKAPFKREKGRVIQIGHPTDFRKEELPSCFSDAETLTPQSSCIMTSEKDETMIEMTPLSSSTKSKVQGQVRRMSMRRSQTGSGSV